jgi:hypothetical protein
MQRPLGNLKDRSGKTALELTLLNSEQPRSVDDYRRLM